MRALERVNCKQTKKATMLPREAALAMRLDRPKGFGSEWLFGKVNTTVT
jgi:hypothetical protein